MYVCLLSHVLVAGVGEPGLQEIHVDVHVLQVHI